MAVFDVINTDEWIEENKEYFLPPVCNKMMHNEGQMKLFFVGGPNQRKDYHIDCGEELFLQLKGDMVLKIREQGTHRDVVIREGEMFLLPGRIEHSPQRFANTVGLVIERDRHPTELDGVRYFTEDSDGNFTSESLYEKWFYCTNLGTQLVPLIKEFFASEQYKTGKPIPGTIPETAPVTLDRERKVQEPFNFTTWLNDHAEQLDNQGKVQVFDGDKYQFQVFVYGQGENSSQHDIAETWIWQWTGSSQVTVGDKTHTMREKDSLLVPAGQSVTVTQSKGARCLVCYQDPTKSTTYPKQQ